MCPQRPPILELAPLPWLGTPGSPGRAAVSAGGGGRFNVVGWDPRGTNGSDPVRCFISQASEARFWRGVQIPTTAAQSRAYERKAIELARRCGQVSGPLLNNISTEDTTRDLNYLRQFVGDRALTYVGLSYGTMIGQIYANIFPTRVRAMLLDAVVAGPARCTLACYPETVAQGHRAPHARGQAVGPVPRLGAMGSLCGELARARHRRAERLLGNAMLLTVASYGHPSYQLPSKCADKWRVRYLVPSVRLLSRQVGLRSRIRRKAFH
jgi:pimeloyl-ACP methyl ester carboxylesterase